LEGKSKKENENFKSKILNFIVFFFFFFKEKHGGLGSSCPNTAPPLPRQIMYFLGEREMRDEVETLELLLYV
jgi:hypothetical protein